MIQRDKYYNRVLKALLEDRFLKNPRYSLRAFAQFLKISPGTLSDIFNGKKPLSFSMAERVLPRLELSPLEEKQFLDSVVDLQKKRKLKRQNPKVKAHDPEGIKLSDLSLEHYKYVSEWHYVTILELTKVEGFKSNPEWIASTLGISTIEAKIAIDSLLELGLLQKDGGKLCKTNAHLRLKDMYTATSAARRKKQKQIREKAINAIDEQDISKRSMTSLTMGIDPADIPEAKKMIEEFTESVCKYFEKSRKKKEVYALEIGLFSLQKRR